MVYISARRRAVVVERAAPVRPTARRSETRNSPHLPGPGLERSGKAGLARLAAASTKETAEKATARQH